MGRAKDNGGRWWGLLRYFDGMSNGRSSAEAIVVVAASSVVCELRLGHWETAGAHWAVGKVYVRFCR